MAQINDFSSTQIADKKRVLFIITQSEMGGAQKFIHAFVTRLDQKKYEICVAAGVQNVDWLGQKLSESGIKFVPLKNLKREVSPVHDIKTLFEIRRLIKDFRPYTIFLASSKAGFIGSLAAVFPTRLPVKKIIYRIGGWTFNDPWPNWKKKLWQILEKTSAEWKDIIIVNNIYDLNQAQKLKIKPRGELVLIHNGLDTYNLNFLGQNEAREKLESAILRNSGNKAHLKRVVGTIANLYPAKGLGSIIETAKYFPADSSVSFVIIGDGMEREKLQTRIKQERLENTVYLVGHLPDGHRYLPAFDVFVLPSLKEGFPWALIEAMAAKLPVIATLTGAVPEIIQDGKNGFIVDKNHPEQMAMRIKEILNSDSLRKELSIQAHQTVLFDFSLDKMISKTENLL